MKINKVSKKKKDNKARSKKKKIEFDTLSSGMYVQTKKIYRERCFFADHLRVFLLEPPADFRARLFGDEEASLF